MKRETKPDYFTFRLHTGCEPFPSPLFCLPSSLIYTIILSGIGIERFHPGQPAIAAYILWLVPYRGTVLAEGGAASMKYMAVSATHDRSPTS